MNRLHKGRLAFIFVVLCCFVLSGLSGCSKEAKKAKHWNRAEKYFSENKFKEAIIEYKNVLQLDPKDATCRYIIATENSMSSGSKPAMTCGTLQ